VSEGLRKMLRNAIVACYEAHFLGVSEENNEFYHGRYPASGLGTRSSVGK
jgi:hypothetical protein